MIRLLPPNVTWIADSSLVIALSMYSVIFASNFFSHRLPPNKCFLSYCNCMCAMYSGVRACVHCHALPPPEFVSVPLSWSPPLIPERESPSSLFGTGTVFFPPPAAQKTEVALPQILVTLPPPTYAFPGICQMRQISSKGARNQEFTAEPFLVAKGNK